MCGIIGGANKEWDYEVGLAAMQPMASEDRNVVILFNGGQYGNSKVFKKV